MKIYTKRGDSGQTDLFGGERVSKANLRVKAYGAVDAANSAIGFVCSSSILPDQQKNLLHGIMSSLFDIGAELATSEKQSAKVKLELKLDSVIDEDMILFLESCIDNAEKDLPALKSFVLPTGSDLAARYHIARTAVRLAEQEVVFLCENGGTVREEILKYINRLSDLFFVLARKSNSDCGLSDIAWKAKKERRPNFSDTLTN